MANRRLDWAGQTRGCLYIIEYDETSYGDSDSSWICRCNNCGSVHSVRATGIRRSPKSCIKCKSKHRTFPIVHKPCLHCGADTAVPNNRAYVYCSKKCRKAAASAVRANEVSESLERYLRRTAAGARSRAKRRGLPCDITADYLVELYKKQEGKCARTGVPLELSNPTAYRRVAPNTISIDRVDSLLGYTRDNIELVTSAFNVAKNTTTHEELYELCKLYIRNYEERLSS